ARVADRSSVIAASRGWLGSAYHSSTSRPARSIAPTTARTYGAWSVSVIVSPVDGIGGGDGNRRRRQGAGPSGRSRDLGSACLVHVVGRDGTQLCEGACEVCARAAQVGGIVGGVGLFDRLVEACHHGVDRVQGVDEAAQRVVQGPGGDVRVGGGVGEIV